MGNFPYYMHVVDGFLVLWRRPPEQWALGEPDTLQRTLVKKDGPSTAFRRVRPEQLPTALQMLPGTRLQLLNSQGVVCEARIEELLLLGQAFTSDYGSELYKRAHLDVKLPSSREEIAQAIWQDSAHDDNLGRSLGARISSKSGTCDNASWARVALGPPPRISPAQAASPVLQREALLRLRALFQNPAWCAAFREFKSNENKIDCGHLLAKPPSEFHVMMFPSMAGMETLISVESLQNGVCTPDSYSVCEIWAVSGLPEQAQLRHLDWARCSLVESSAKAAVSFNHSDEITFLGPEGLRVYHSPKITGSFFQSDSMYLPNAFFGESCEPPTSVPAHDRHW